MMLWLLGILLVGAVGGEDPGAGAGEKRLAIAALVVSGHKAVSKHFVEQSACATMTMVATARSQGGFRGDAVLLAGPLGEGSPHDRSSWKKGAPKEWEHEHRRLVRQLDSLLATAISVVDLVPLILSDRYPFMRRNLNYMKLAVYTLAEYDAVMFIDLDVVVIEPLGPFFALLTPEVDLVGYRTCTAPVNSGFFVVRPDKRSYHLSELNSITMRNDCPCRIVGTFAELGYDRHGPISAEIGELWRRPKLDGRPASRELCAKVVQRRRGTWELAGAGTGQGLMWYYYGIKRRRYLSLTYDELPIVHYNSPGPKPWAPAASTFDLTRTDLRQHCDFVWWRAHLEAARQNATSFAVCRDLFAPRLDKKQSVGHFGDSACCRSCPGGGHFATSQRCSATTGLSDYVMGQCRVVGELASSSSSSQQRRPHFESY